jgi:TonB family protein
LQPTKTTIARRATEPTLDKLETQQETLVAQVEPVEVAREPPPETASGTVGGVWVMTSSGLASFDESAVEAAHTWHFDPERRRGVFVTAVFDWPVTFRIERRS